MYPCVDVTEKVTDHLTGLCYENKNKTVPKPHLDKIVITGSET